MPITSAYLDASARYHLEYARRLTIDPVNGSSNCSAVQTPKRRRVRFPLPVNIPTANFLGIRLHHFYLPFGHTEQHLDPRTIHHYGHTGDMMHIPC